MMAKDEESIGDQMMDLRLRIYHNYVVGILEGVVGTDIASDQLTAAAMNAAAQLTVNHLQH